MSRSIPEGTRGRGFKGSSDMLKNYKDLKDWHKFGEHCLEIFRITAKVPKKKETVKLCGIKDKMRCISYGSVYESEPCRLSAGSIQQKDHPETNHKILLFHQIDIEP